jgi:hypothetical protein
MLDLIDDRAISESDADLLDHNAIADELTSLVRSVPTASNLALYGAWGSGKTSLGNLLGARLKPLWPKIKFARFDALKYAEHSLRRHFLSQLAKQLKVGDRKYQEGLYTEEETTTIRLPKQEIRLILSVAVGAWALIQILSIAVGFLAALVANADPKATIGNALTVTLVPAIPVASVLGLLGPLFGQAFQVKRSASHPSSEEQFENLFRDLVKESHAERLVVLIDELDRCSPSQVVVVLETLRTFLDVSPCVFVVTADQQALEHALNESLRQSTPADPQNPYYSTGGAYLDKIFQYQLPLPVLRPRRLSAFALRLVQNRGGVWEEVDREQVVSILVPTHVASPRRVKTLLNAFVLAYHLARRRADDHRIPVDIHGRARELAKLVCLRVEFPLFAKDLLTYPRLPDLVLLHVDGVPKPETIPAEQWQRAKAFAEGQLEPDVLLSPSNQGSVLRTLGRDLENSTDETQNPPVTTPATESGQFEGDYSFAGAESNDAAVRKQFGHQLVSYLYRTAHVGPIGEDLLYLESPGAAFGLPPDIAIDLENAAADGRLPEVISLITKLDEEFHVPALRLLVQQLKESSFGIERSNVVSSLLAATEQLDFPTAAVHVVADAVVMHSVKANPQSNDYRPGYGLALHAGGIVGQRLGTWSLSHGTALDDAEFCLALLADPRALPEEHLQTEAAAFARTLSAADTAPRAINTVSRRNLGDLAQLVAATVEPYRQIFDERGDSDAPQDSEQPEQDAMADAYELALSQAVKNGRPTADLIALFGLLVDNVRYRNKVHIHLLALTESPVADFVAASLDAGERRTVSTWPAWLGVADPTVLTSEELNKACDRYVARLIELVMGPDPPDKEDRIDATKALIRLRGGKQLDLGRTDSLSRTQLSARMESVPLNEVVKGPFSDSVDALAQIANEGLLETESLADDLAKKLAALISQPATSPVISAAPAVTAVLGRWIPFCSESASCEATELLAGALKVCPWLPHPQQDTLLLEASAGVAQCGEIEPPLTYAQIQLLATAHGASFDAGLATWLATFAKSVGEVWNLVAEMAPAPSVREPINSALRAYTERLSPAERLDLLRPAIRVDPGHAASRSFLAACRWSEVDGKGAVALLAALYQSSTRFEEREAIIRYADELAATGDTRKRIVAQVVLPIAGEGKQALDCVLKHIHLLDPPPEGLRGSIREALTRGARDRGQRRRVRETLEKLGLVKVSSGLIGKRTSPVD